MPKLVKIPDVRPLVLGHYTLHATGIDIKGHPSFEEHQGVWDFAQSANRRSGFWLASLARYGDSRHDWQGKISQLADSTGLTEKTLKNIRAVGAIDPSRRRDDVEFGHHEAVAALEPAEQTEWLAKAATHGWSVRDLRLNIRSSRRRKVIEGQAVLEGQYRVWLADCPWLYGNKPPSGSGAQTHYNGMTIAQLCELPVAAHATRDAVLFMWVTAPMLYENPGPREVIEAWGFKPKTGLIWDKVNHNFGNYVSIRHEHLLIATRGSCLPDRPTPMFDSVLTERQDGMHSSKPASVRTMIERLYDGPRIELFARERVEGWSSFGDDAQLWLTTRSA